MLSTNQNIPKESNCETYYKAYKICMLKNLHEKELAPLHCQEETAEYIKCWTKYSKKLI